MLVEKIPEYEAKGKALAGQVFDILAANPIHGMYVTGSGPNAATAMEAGLILSESTKRSPWRSTTTVPKKPPKTAS